MDAKPPEPRPRSLFRNLVKISSRFRPASRETRTGREGLHEMKDEPPRAEKEAKREAARAKGRAHVVTVTLSQSKRREARSGPRGKSAIESVTGTSSWLKL
jgi:hypothetical protein